MDYLAFYEQLKKKAPQKVYLFEGEEEFIKESALSDLKKALLTGPLAMMNENVLTNPQDSALIAACETLPVMEDRRLVIVKEMPQLSGRDGAKNGDGEGAEEEEEKPVKKGDALSHYLSKLPDTVCLVFFARGKARGSSRLYKKIKELGGIVCFDQLEGESLVKWIAREFKGYGLMISRHTVERLTFACGKDLMRLKGEIAKIASYAQGQTAVTDKDIDRIATLSVDYKVFDLADKVADGLAEKALPLMEEMLRSGEQRLMLLALLQRHYRQLLFTRIMMDGRLPQSAIAGELGLPSFVVRRLMNSAAGYTARRLKTAYLKCVEQEFLVKSGQIQEDGSLEQLVYALIDISGKGKENERA